MRCQNNSISKYSDGHMQCVGCVSCTDIHTQSDGREGEWFSAPHIGKHFCWAKQSWKCSSISISIGCGVLVCVCVWHGFECAALHSPHFPWRSLLQCSSLSLSQLLLSFSLSLSLFACFFFSFYFVFHIRSETANSILDSSIWLFRMVHFNRSHEFSVFIHLNKKDTIKLKDIKVLVHVHQHQHYHAAIPLILIQFFMFT